MMPGRRVVGTVCAFLLCAVVLWSCAGGGAKNGEGAKAAPAPEAPQPAQAANDPARPQAPAANDVYDPATAAGAVKGVPAPTNTAPIEAVANFYTEIPGYDLTTLDPRTREKFLHRVNSELCTCGCKNDTLAHCIVNDPKCPSVGTLVRKVYDQVTTEP